MRRLGLAVVLVTLCAGGGVAAHALADNPPPPQSTTSTEPTESTPGPTEPTTTPTEPRPKPRQAARIAAGVSIAGIHVGGLAYGPAYSAVSVAFRSYLALRLGDKAIGISPWKLGAKPHIGPAVLRALRAKPGTDVQMVVSVHRSIVESYIDGIARRFDRDVADAHVVLRDLQPVVMPEVEGRKVDRKAAVVAIVQALQRNERGRIEIPATIKKPTVKSDSIDPIIVIRRDSKALYFYRQVKVGEPVQFVRSFPVATGQPIYPTPTGDFSIIVMERNPWWYPPPDSAWAKGEKPIPPGPGNPLGTRWMGLSAPNVGIHGTPDPASLGYSASHGCIRMYIPSAEWLFSHVRVGTPVLIRPV